MGEKFIQQIRLVILLAVGLLASHSSKAAVIGAELGYEVTDDMLYVDLTVFDNFNRASYLNRYVTVKSTTSKTVFTGYLDLVSQNDISPVCKSACTNYKQSTCNNDFTVVQTVYRAKFDLSNFETGDCELVMSWSQRGRLASEDNFYISSMVNKCVEAGNSSPAIINAPYPFPQFNDEYSYSWQAKDADGDSLVYRLIESKHSEFDIYQYAKGLSHTAPLQYIGHPNKGGQFPKGFHFDSRYGLLQFYPTKVMSAPVCVMIEEYRKGEKIGETTRDLMFEVKSVTNEKPKISGINGTNKTHVTACVGQEVCFEIETEDVDVQNPLELSWRTDVAEATITKTSNRKPTLKFCWTPTAKDLGRKAFYLMAEAEEVSCELNGLFEKLITIEVVEPFEASFTSKNQNCSEVSFKATTDDGNARKYSYEWTMLDKKLTGKNIVVNGTPGEFEATVNVVDKVSGCKDSYTGKFSIPTPEKVDGGIDKILCPGDEVTFTAQGTKSFSWTNANGEELSTSNTITLPLEESSAFIVRGVDDNGCITFDSVKATVREIQLKAIAPTLSACVGTEVEIQLDGNKDDDVQWSNFGFVGSDASKAVYAFKRDAIVKVKGTDINGCEATATAQVLIDTDCVHPGDVNGDGWVNHKDVLGIGLGFNLENPMPSNSTPIDQVANRPYKSTNWGITLNHTGRDVKHADANQSGMVEASDVIVIDQHYHTNYSGFITSKKKGTGLPIEFSKTVTKVNGDDTTFEVDILLGTKDKPAKDVYGISFSIAYNDNVSSSSIKFNTDNSWLKSDKSTTVQVIKNVKNKTGGGGEIQVGFSRTNKVAVSGSGSIGKLTFVVDDDNIGWSDKKDLEDILKFQIKSIKMVDNDGERISAYGELANFHYFHLYGMTQRVENHKPGHSLQLTQSSDDNGADPDAIVPEFEKVSVFPNPVTNGSLYYSVPVGMSNVQVSVSDLSGKVVVEKYSSVTGVNSMDVSALKGYYILTFEGSQGAKVIPIIIN